MKPLSGVFKADLDMFTRRPNKSVMNRPFRSRIWLSFEFAKKKSAKSTCMLLSIPASFWL
jgi:hypothetical protein